MSHFLSQRVRTIQETTRCNTVRYSLRVARGGLEVSEWLKGSSKPNPSMLKVTIGLIGTVAITVLFATAMSVNSQAIRSDQLQLQRTLDLLSTSRSVSSGVVTDGTAVHISRSAHATLLRICSALKVELVVLPSYDAVPTSPSGAGPQSSLTISNQPSIPVNPSTSPQLGTQSAPALRLCAPTHNYLTQPLLASETLRRGHNRTDAVITAALSAPNLLGSLLTVLRTELWVPLVLGIVVALGLFRLRVLARRETFGLSSLELSSLLQEQEALLKGISEGVIGCDSDGIVRFFNSEAQRILRLPSTSVGRPLEHLIRGKRLRQVLLGEVAGRDLPVVVGQTVLSVSRMAVERDGAPQGTVITLQDRTEWEALIRELDGMVGMTEALRAQAHEFSNKLHTMVGLIQLGQSEEAIKVAVNLSMRRDFSTARLERLDDHLLRALLLAKEAVASEKGIELSLKSESSLSGRLASPLDILTVVGNLIDNAIEEVQNSALLLLSSVTSATPSQGWVEVWIHQDGRNLTITVSDSGGGVPTELVHSIFTDGVSTKSSLRGARRGLGLALVAQVAAKYGGSVSVVNRPGATFRVDLPNAVRANHEVSNPHRVALELQQQGLGTSTPLIFENTELR